MDWIIFTDVFIGIVALISVSIIASTVTVLSFCEEKSPSIIDIISLCIIISSIAYFCGRIFHNGI